MLNKESKTVQEIKYQKIQLQIKQFLATIKYSYTGGLRKTDNYSAILI